MYWWFNVCGLMCIVQERRIQSVDDNSVASWTDDVIGGTVSMLYWICVFGWSHGIDAVVAPFLLIRVFFRRAHVNQLSSIPSQVGLMRALTYL